MGDGERVPEASTPGNHCGNIQTTDEEVLGTNMSGEPFQALAVDAVYIERCGAWGRSKSSDDCRS
jgi:hypothetical protein